MKTSESIKALLGALSKAQGEIGNATKNANNPHFKSKYADLAEVLETIRPVASKFGLCFTQCPAMRDGKLIVETMLGHESGEWIIFEGAETALSKNDAQGVGSAVTYLRRYSLASVFGIAQDDDDGNAATKQPKQQTTAMPSYEEELSRLGGKHSNVAKVYAETLKVELPKLESPEQAEKVARELHAKYYSIQ